MSEDFLARAERIFARMKMSSRVVEPELPPVVEGVKDERRYVPQAAAPVGAAPEPEPELVVAKGEVVPEPQPRRHRIDLLACDEPRPQMKPSELDFWTRKDERDRRLGKWAWMTW